MKKAVKKKKISVSASTEVIKIEPVLKPKVKKVSPKVSRIGPDGLKLTKPSVSAEEQKLINKWTQLFEKAKEESPAAYDMTRDFPPKSALKHKILGWGYVLSSHNNRIEVLFENGIKTLISNYKE
ncbi:MAG: hypothetical protein SGJ18_03425 [Pseudomonadota bacterium]|nr:hypothetical protein [Pseudomonadota bacterium]